MGGAVCDEGGTEALHEYDSTGIHDVDEWELHHNLVHDDDVHGDYQPHSGGSFSILVWRHV